MADLRRLAFFGFLGISGVFVLLACGSGSEDSSAGAPSAGASGSADASGGSAGLPQETGGNAPWGDSGGGTSASGSGGAAGAGQGGGDIGGAAGEAGQSSGGAGGEAATDAGTTPGPTCPGIILAGASCDTDALTCPNPCMAPCTCEAGAWTCAAACACPDSDAHTADPCLQAGGTCQFPIASGDPDAEVAAPQYGCVCKEVGSYGTRWFCQDKATQQPLCPVNPSTWSCLELGIDACVKGDGSGTCTCDAEGVFVCGPG
ncbi:MAG TPA: hypothetical protein PLI95_07915 [Polyangiaceae bacterium]|nr:hypothetical protein [Polyangiaceae bacterium]